MPAFLAGQTDPEHCIHIVQPGHQHRSCGVDHDYSAVCSAGDCAYQIILPTRQRQRLLVLGLGLLFGGQSNHHNCGIGVPSSQRCIIDQLVVRRSHWLDDQPG